MAVGEMTLQPSTAPAPRVHGRTVHDELGRLELVVETGNIGARGIATTDMARLFPVTFRQLDYWNRTGLLVPSHSTADGYGSRRRYSLDDVTVLRVLLPAIQLGMLFAVSHGVVTPARMLVLEVIDTPSIADRPFVHVRPDGTVADEPGPGWTVVPLPHPLP